MESIPVRQVDGPKLGLGVLPGSIPAELDENGVRVRAVDAMKAQNSAGAPAQGGSTQAPAGAAMKVALAYTAEDAVVDRHWMGDSIVDCVLVSRLFRVHHLGHHEIIWTD